LVLLTSDGLLAGGITAMVIKWLYMEQFPGLLNNGDIFLYTERILYRICYRNWGLKLTTEWPPYLLDLNSIENIWAMMKIVITNNYPKLQNALDNEPTLLLLI